MTKIKLLEGQSYPIKPESVFYNVKQILLIQKNEKATTLSADMRMWADLKLRTPDILNLIKELEKRYQTAMFKHTTARKSKTLGEFCKICANDLNKEIPLNEKSRMENILQTIKSFLKEHYGYTNSELTDDADIEHDLLLDSLTRIELLEELETVFNAQLSDNMAIYYAKTLKEYAIACVPHITNTPKQNKIKSIKSNYQKTIATIARKIYQR